MFRCFWLIFGALCILVYWLCWSSLLYAQGSGFKDVPPAGPAPGAEVGGGIIFVTPGEFADQHQTLPVKLAGGL